MKRILLFLFALSAALIGSAQITTKVQTDSLLIYQVKSFPAELILKSRTSNRTGAFLRNRFDGRTEFAYALDSAWMRDGNLVFRRGTDSLTFLLNNLTQVNAGSGIRKTGSVFHLGNELIEDANIWGRNWSTYFGDPTRRINTFNVYARGGVTIYDSISNGYAPSLQLMSGSATLQGRNATLYGGNITTFQSGNLAYLTAPNMLMEGTTSFVFGGVAQQQTTDSSAWKPVVIDGSGNIRKGWWFGGGAGVGNLNQVLTNGNTSGLSAQVSELRVQPLAGAGGQHRLRVYNTGGGMKWQVNGWDAANQQWFGPGELDIQVGRFTINNTNFIVGNNRVGFGWGEVGSMYVKGSSFDGLLDSLNPSTAGWVITSNGPGQKPSYKPIPNTGSSTTFQGALTNGSALTSDNDVTGNFRMGFGTSGSRISSFNAYTSGNINLNAAGVTTVQAGSLNFITAPQVYLEGTSEVTLAGKPMTMVADTNNYKPIVRDASGNLRSAPWLGAGPGGSNGNDTLVLDSRPGLTYRASASPSTSDTLTQARASVDSNGFLHKTDFASFRASYTSLTALGDSGVIFVRHNGTRDTLIIGASSSSGGAATWGSITGTLSAQSDLQSALNAKANTSHGHAIADVTGLQSALDGKQASGDYATNSALTSGLSGKQATLVSGTNIKTINGNSILGSGDLTVSGGSATPAGSDGEVQFNLSGAFGTISGVNYGASQLRAPNFKSTGGYYFNGGEVMYISGTSLVATDNAGNALEAKWGRTVISNTFADVAPLNGLFVKGAIKNNYLAGTGTRLVQRASDGTLEDAGIDPLAVSQAITQASAASTEAGNNFYQEVQFSGDGSTTSFVLTISGTATWASATPSSSAAAAPFYVTVGASNVTVHFTTAPATGTNNIKLFVHYRK